MNTSVFDYDDYKAYLRELIRSKGANGRGERMRLADSLRCHSAYISRVLKDSAHLSPEQAIETSRHFSHNTDEAHFFLLLVQWARAGTRRLREHYAEQIRQVRAKRLDLKNRLDFKRSLSTEDQLVYYSEWHYAAVHVLISVPSLQTKDALARYLRLSPKKITEVLRFLASVGLAIQEGERYRIGTATIHLAADSPMISKHHANWLVQSMKTLDRRTDEFHYSSVVTLSRADLPQVRKIMTGAIEQIRATVKDSKEEAGYCYLLHLFEVGESI